MQGILGRWNVKWLLAQLVGPGIDWRPWRVLRKAVLDEFMFVIVGCLQYEFLYSMRHFPFRLMSFVRPKFQLLVCQYVSCNV